MTAVLNALAIRAELVGSTELARLLRGALPHIDEIVNDLLEARQDPDWKHSDGLILPSLMGLLGDFDRAGDDFGALQASIIHDETREFSGLLLDAFSRAKSATSSEHRVNTGKSLRLGYSVLDDLRFARSHDEPLIQAADILASALRIFASGDDQGRQGHDRLWQLCSRVLTRAADSRSVGCHMAGSDAFFARLGRSMRANA
jgi:hypothetical protein